jgi:hypothetical protein
LEDKNALIKELMKEADEKSVKIENLLRELEETREKLG